MNKKQKNRLLIIISILIILSMAGGLILYALKQNINLFYTPTQLLQAAIDSKQTIRVGGYVKKQSVIYDKSGEYVSFIITDRTHELPIQYHGVLPNLFREGQAVVVTGQLTSKGLIANQVLAKHDEKYMPRALEKELKKEVSHGT